MAGKIDITKLAQRLTELNTKKGGGSNLGFISIADGRNVVRILPPKDGAEWFAQEVFVHYGVGKKDKKDKGTMVVCPTTHGEDKACPVCELAKEFYKLSKKKDDTYSKQAREVGRKKRVYYNAIDRSEDLSVYTKNDDGKWVNADGEEESPVKVLATGIDVYKNVMGIIVDPEYGDITDSEQGLDVIITKSGTGFNTNYDVKTVRKESAIGFDGWEECLNDLSVLATVKTYDEIAAIMQGEDDSVDTSSLDDNDNEDDAEDTKDTKNSKGNKADDSADDSDVEDEIRQALARRRGGKK